MIHYGDITKIHGDQVPAVHVITGGSPCQDLSVAGKRAGLAGERSGLFMEQIRIVKEMRENDRRNYAGADNADRLIRPRFMVWENVPGAFSSNKGEDFRAVLEETAKVADKDAVIPGPPGGKWTPAGCIMGDGWSIAWRVHDAQFWGVPQRRKRIALVADFGGECAPEILFERESVSGDTEKSGKEGQEAAGDAGAGTQEPSAFTLKIRGGANTYIKPDGSIGTAGKGPLIQTEKSGTLGVSQDQTLIAFEPGAASHVGGHTYEDVAGTVRANAGDNQQAVVYGIGSYDSNAMKSDNPHSGIYEADTSRTLDLNGGNPACNQGGMAVVQAAGVDTYNQTMDDEIAQPLRAADGGDSTPKVVCLEDNGSRPSHQGDGWHEGDSMYTLNSTEHHAVCVENHTFSNVAATLSAADGSKGVHSQMMKNPEQNFVLENEPIVGSKAQFFMHNPSDGKALSLVSTDYKDPQIVCQPETYQKITGTVCARISAGTSNQLASDDMFVANTSIVRRLTPLECTRLQGFPDGWVDIGEWVDSKGKVRKDSDANKYKALGNSIALPFWEWMAKRMIAVLNVEHPTMASLFDGIGGFPLVFSRVGCKPVWASEIEEFPIAVTKKRLGEE